MFVNDGSSQGLLSQIEVGGTGDLFLPADASYLELAKAKGIVNEIFPVALIQVGVAVARGNPKQIRTFTYLLREDVRILSSADPATQERSAVLLGDGWYLVFVSDFDRVVDRRGRGVHVPGGVSRRDCETVIRASIRLAVLTCSVSAILSMLVAIPLSYSLVTVPFSWPVSRRHAR